jgi:hypothetical protein
MHEEHREHHGYGRHWRHGHYEYRGFPRGFLTKEEKANKLESCVQELKDELAAVRDRIKELRTE